MKVPLIAVLLVLCLVGQTAQSQIFKDKRPYKVWVSRLDTDNKTEGYLVQAKDSSILVSQSLAYAAATTQEINATNISSLKFRKKGKVGRSIWQGALAGFAVGGVVGLTSIDPFAVLVTIPLTPLGAVIGGGIGTIRTRVSINGNLQQYHTSKAQLSKYVITPVANKPVKVTRTYRQAK